MDAIMNLYSEEKNKQIFISFDELADFNITTQKIVEDNKVISLAPGGMSCLVCLGIRRNKA